MPAEYKQTPKEFLFRYIPYIPLFIICISAALFITWLRVRYQNPSYETMISLYFKTEDKPKQGGTDLKIDELGLNDKKINLFNEIELMKSPEIMERVVKGLQLNCQYFNEGSIKKSEIYSWIFVHMRAGGHSTGSIINRIRAHKEDYLAWQINETKHKWYTIILKPLRKVKQFIITYKNLA